MIGDKQSDLDAAKAAGMEAYLFDGANLQSFITPLLAQRCRPHLTTKKRDYRQQ